MVSQKLHVVGLSCLIVCALKWTQEAIAIVLDVGPAMNQAPPGESTDLQTSLDAINMILQRKVKFILDRISDSMSKIPNGRSVSLTLSRNIIFCIPVYDCKGYIYRTICF